MQNILPQIHRGLESATDKAGMILSDDARAGLGVKPMHFRRLSSRIRIEYV
jgi:hypothetical protein